jgi:hypothetical protein
MGKNRPIVGLVSNYHAARNPTIPVKFRLLYELLTTLFRPFPKIER